MKTNGWLTINNRGSMKLTKNQPGLDWNEVSVKIEVDLPSELFSRPRLQASIKIPNDAVGPDVINSTVIANCKDAIKSVTGLEMKISVIKEDEETENCVQ